MKYLPHDYGGNVIFPIMMLTNFREYRKTQYNSFDQRSFFPHTDEYKLMVAICENDMVLAEQIVNRCPEILRETGMWRETTALGLAAMLNRVEMCEYLIERGAKPNVQGADSNTPLMHAVV
jgi:hypothetical protein